MKPDATSFAQWSLIFVMSCTLILSGCTSQSVGTPFPDPADSDDTSSTETSSRNSPRSDEELPTNGAPKVANPMDVSHFEQNPCDMLTPNQTQTLDLPTTGQPIEDAVGKGCRWRNNQSRGIATIYFSSSDKRGLSSVYREAEGRFPHFERIDDVEGYPAVAFSTEEKDPTVTCTVVVGVSDQLVFGVRFGVTYDNLGKVDPCESGAQVAGMMMTTMREAS